MRKNSENPGAGAKFQNQVYDWFIRNCGGSYELEKKIPIGEPSKDHKFDIVGVDKAIAIECKCYSWTETGNVPSAKMGFCNEAAFYLSFLPNTYEKYIVISFAWHEKRQQTLAEYYYETNRHLLKNIKVAEYDPDKDEFHIIG